MSRSPGRRAGRRRRHPGAAAALAARAGVPRAARRRSPSTAPRSSPTARWCRRPRSTCRGTAGSTCTSRCCPPGAEPRRSSTRSWPATRSPAPRRSGSRPGLDTGPVFGTVTEPIGPRDTAGDLLGRLARERRRPAGRHPRRHRRRHAGRRAAAGRRHQPRAPDRARRRPGRLVAARRTWSTGGSAGSRRRPGAWTTWRGERLRLGPGRAAARRRPALAAGELAVRPRAACSWAPAAAPSGSGDVQPAGKRMLPAADWARGARPAAGERVGA